MRAIAINPYTEQVYVCEIARKKGDSSIEPIYEQLRKDDQRFSGTFTVIDLGDGETLYIDDEGHLEPGRACFLYGHYGHPLAGSGLILGTDEEGASIATKLDIRDVQAAVKFPAVESTGDFTDGYEKEIDHPVLGKATYIHAGDPIVAKKGTWKRDEVEDLVKKAGLRDEPL